MSDAIPLPPHPNLEHDEERRRVAKKIRSDPRILGVLRGETP